jgi:hypothetical protein
MHVSGAGANLLRELASGVDALYLSGNGYLSKGFLARLEEGRIFADRVSEAVPFELGPLTLGLRRRELPHGCNQIIGALMRDGGDLRPRCDVPLKPCVSMKRTGPPYEAPRP